MNTLSKEALEAARDVRCVIQRPFGWQPIGDTEMAAIIDRHFEPLRRDNSTLAGRLTAAELERDDIGARAEQAEARVKELEGDLKTVAKAEFYLRHTNAEIEGALRDARNMILMLESVAKFSALPGHYPMDGLDKLDKVLARHAAGEPAKPMMRDDPRYKGTSYGEVAKQPEATS